MAMKSSLKGKSVSVWLILLPVAVIGITTFSFLELRASVTRAQASLLTSASERIAFRVSGQLSALLDVGQQFRSVVLEVGDASFGAIKSIADAALHRYPCISAITLAPGAIIRYSFPEEKTSASIGHDLLDNPERMQALVQAVSKKQVVLQGPDMSAEGVNLAFLRFPVFRAQDLWGFISIAIDVDTMLNALALKDEFPGLRITCATRGGGKSGSGAFWGDRHSELEYTSPIVLGKDESGWSISVAPVYPASRAIWWGGAIAVLAILGGAGLLLCVARAKANPKAKPQPRREHFDVSPFSAFEPYENKIDTGTKKVVESIATKETVGAPPVEHTSGDEAANSNDAKREVSQAFSSRPNVEEPEENAVQPPTESRELAAPGYSAPHAAPARAPSSVLIVDDSEVNRELLLRMLTLKGYRVESLADGALALEMLDTRDFDVLLIDCIMPDMDGYTLASAVRKKYAEPSAKGGGLLTKTANTYSKAPKLIAMSPRHDAEEAEKCARAGFNGLLIKPFTMTSLDQKIREMLDVSSGAGK